MTTATSESDVYDGLREANLNLIDTQSKLQTLRAELSRLQLLEQWYLSEIETKRQFVQSRCFIDKIATDDILSHAFEYLVHDFDSKYPWLLELVCKRWRNVCLQCPKLWSYFRLSSHESCDDGDRYDHAMVIRTLLQLDRSKSSPLFIEVATLCQCDSQVARIKAVVNHCSRWRRMDFEIQPALSGITAFPPVNASGVLKGLIPSTSKFLDLREITWSCTSSAHFCALELPFADLTDGALPKLSNVRLHHMENSEGIEAHLPWSQLTSLDLCFTPGRHFRREFPRALFRCNRLVTLSLLIRQGGQLQDATVDGAPDDVTETVTLTNVIAFKLLATNADLLGPITAHIELPSLRSLTVGFISLTQLQPVIDFLRQSSCGKSLKLLHLAVAEEMVDVSLLLLILEQCLDLHSFIFECVRELSVATTADTTNQLLQSLATHEGTTSLLPRLQYLSLIDFRFNPIFMIQMVDSRIAGGCLRRLKVDYPLPAGTDAEREYVFCKTLLERQYATSDVALTFI